MILSFAENYYIIKNRRNMIFFSSKQHRNCLSAKNSRRKYRYNRECTEPNDSKNTKNRNPQEDKQNMFQSHDTYQNAPHSVDPYKEQMKFLIEKNSEYFQNKVKITDKARPNQYRFKIPTRTPITIYKKNFSTKDKDFSVDNVKLNRNNLSQTIKSKEPEEKLLFKSTYQNEYILKKQSLKNRGSTIARSKRNKEQQSKKKEDQVPRFMETQNKCFYLNWGGRNSVTSLKPSYQTTVNNFPFSGKTVYKNDFQGKEVVPSKLIIPESSINKLSSSLMISQSSYANDFSRNQIGAGEVQKSYKPKYVPVKMSENFKGASEYKSQFIPNKEITRGLSHEIKKQELHALIMEL